MVILYPTSIGNGMKPEKKRPTLTKNTKSNKTSKKGLLFALALLLLLIVITYFVWPRPLPSSPTAVKDTPTAVEQADAAHSVANDSATQTNAIDNVETAADTNNIDNDSSLDGSAVTASDSNTPSPKAILNAPLPQTDSLAKEEVDRLDDERKRLIEQEKLAADQIAMNKKLTEMKAEQIKLLEQQIAELEATQASESVSQ